MTTTVQEYDKKIFLRAMLTRLCLRALLFFFLYYYSTFILSDNNILHTVCVCVFVYDNNILLYIIIIITDWQNWYKYLVNAQKCLI